jgi:hypothetical protein
LLKVNLDKPGAPSPVRHGHLGNVVSVIHLDGALAESQHRLDALA